MKRYIVLISCLFVSISVAGSQGGLRSLTNDEINQEFHKAFKINGKSRITKNKLDMLFGPSDSISEDSQWTGGKRHIYRLTDDRKIKADILNGQIMLVIIENADGSNYLLWK